MYIRVKFGHPLIEIVENPLTSNVVNLELFLMYNSLFGNLIGSFVIVIVLQFNTA